MTRRLVSLIAIAAMVFALMPATGAMAAAASTARLDSGLQVFPAAGQEFKVRVANGESAGLLGVGSGRQINWVRVIPPREVGVTTAAAATPVPGWTARVTKTANADFITYTANESGDRIAPGGNKTFDVLGNVGAPTNGDRMGAWQVAVSSNNGETTQLSGVTAGGSLTTAIKVLEILSVTHASPAKAVANTAGTVGQTVGFNVAIRNHAQNVLSVQPSLASSDGRDNVTPSGARDIAGNRGELIVNFPVLLGATGGQQRSTTFTGSATSANATSAPAGFNAANARSIINVQAAPVINLVASSFRPTDVRGNVNFPVTVTANKTNIPAYDVAVSSVQFRRQDQQTRAFPKAAGDINFAANATSKELEYPEAIFDLAVTSFNDGRYSAVFVFEGEDGNGFPLNVERTLADIINLDNIAPVIDIITQTLPTDRDAVRQERVKNDDSVTVTGRIDDPSIAALQFLRLVDAGGATLFDVPAANITYGNAGGNRTFSATFRPTFAALNTGAYRYDASAQDAAGNTGGIENDAVAVTDIDNLRPVLPGRETGSGPRGSIVLDDRYDARPVAIAQFDDNFPLVGGCNAASYRVDGQLLVQRVLYSNGEPCNSTSGTAAGPGDNRRVLILSQTIDRSGNNPTPAITYTQTPQLRLTDDTKDKAGQYAANGIQDTLNELAPLAPVLIDVVRGTDGRGRGGMKETATFDEGAYFTRFAGNDLEITVSGAIAGDFFSVTGGNNSTNERVDEDGTATVRVSVAANQDARQEFVLRFISNTGVPGATTPLTVIYDIIDPEFGDANRIDRRNVDVTFSEIVLGAQTNRAAHWIGLETVTTDDGTFTANRSVSEVSGSGATRRLVVEYPNETSNFAGVEYTFDGTGNVYEDRAGNLLTDPDANQPESFLVSPR